MPAARREGRPPVRRSARRRDHALTRGSARGREAAAKSAQLHRWRTVASTPISPRSRHEPQATRLGEVAASSASVGGARIHEVARRRTIETRRATPPVAGRRRRAFRAPPMSAVVRRPRASSATVPRSLERSLDVPGGRADDLPLVPTCASRGRASPCPPPYRRRGFARRGRRRRDVDPRRAARSPSVRRARRARDARVARFTADATAFARDGVVEERVAHAAERRSFATTRANVVGRGSPSRSSSCAACPPAASVRSPTSACGRARRRQPSVDDARVHDRRAAADRRPQPSGACRQLASDCVVFAPQAEASDGRQMSRGMRRAVFIDTTTARVAQSRRRWLRSPRCRRPTTQMSRCRLARREGAVCSRAQLRSRWRAARAA